MKAGDQATGFSYDGYVSVPKLSYISVTLIRIPILKKSYIFLIIVEIICMFLAIIKAHGVSYDGFPVVEVRVNKVLL